MRKAKLELRTPQWAAHQYVRYRVDWEAFKENYKKQQEATGENSAERKVIDKQYQKAYVSVKKLQTFLIAINKDAVSETEMLRENCEEVEKTSDQKIDDPPKISNPPKIDDQLAGALTSGGNEIADNLLTQNPPTNNESTIDLLENNSLPRQPPMNDESTPYFLHDNWKQQQNWQHHDHAAECQWKL